MNDEVRPQRQAVVLIHGIGEQRPSDTLRSFVAAFLAKDTYHSKPDTLSDSFELRRFKLRKCLGRDLETNADWPETDFYEYYWAHQMYGTTFSHIGAWLWITLRRGLAAFSSEDPAYHPRIKTLVRIVCGAALLTGAVAVLMAAYRERLTPRALGAGVAAVLGLALWRSLRGTVLRVVTDSAGDAARYFDVNPKNVPRRYDILRGGVAMLRKLHEDCDTEEPEDSRSGGPPKVMYRYSRVVLVGHSLGSVIAYDILRHYWHEVNGSIPVDPEDFLAVESFEHGESKASFAGAQPYNVPARFREEQHRAWYRLNKKTPPGQVVPRKDKRWLVTDLVTLGSPLTYAPLLMADRLDDLKEKTSLREFPTCPPDRSRHLEPGRFTVKLSAEADRFRDYYILPQGALFAVTRWTNIFFRKDPVGGPLGPVFGCGIDDVEVPNGGLWALRSHVSYWDDGDDAKPSHDRLQRILRDAGAG